MKILFIQNRMLLPADTGGKIRTYNILKYLAQWHEITYLCNLLPGQELTRASWKNSACGYGPSLGARPSTAASDSIAISRLTSSPGSRSTSPVTLARVSDRWGANSWRGSRSI